MTTNRNLFVFVLILLGVACHAVAGSGDGSVKISQLLKDEVGNQSLYYRSFNEYEGLGLSLERFGYRFDNGLRLNADLRNLTLNNRNLQFDLSKPGDYGMEVANSQYRRVYSFDGHDFTRRHRTALSLWSYPNKYVKVYGGLDRVGKSGLMGNLFGLDAAEPIPARVDFHHLYGHGGVAVNHLGRLFQAEYRMSDFTDELSDGRDQSSSKMRFNMLAPVPDLDAVVVQAGFQRFVTEFSETDFGLFSNTGWGGVTVGLPQGVSFKYSVYLNRAGSDSDLVATDNLANSLFAGYTRPGLGGVTIGYQHDLQDDFEDEIKGQAIYLAGWVQPTEALSFRATFGNRVEDVLEGSRLIGDESRNRFRLSGRYRIMGKRSLSLKFEDKSRKNHQLGTKQTFKRGTADIYFHDMRYGTLSAGYAYSKGHYDNVNEGNAFEFRDHLVYGDVESREYRQVTGGFGGTYYRSRRDLNVESFSLRMKLDYRFMNDYRAALTYDAHNFDDFWAADAYYTANILEISIIRDISF